jgi:thiol:disulfide interchange protein DsbD
VLPLIPIKILSLSRAASADPWRCVVLGMLTFLGVMAFWMTLGVMMAGISGFTATNQLFQYPAFTITVGVIIMVMALGMMGVFATKLPGFIYRFNPDQESALGAFGLGILTAVLSTPCTAPFMGAAAAWAAAQQPLIALMVFAAIGTGMGLPYLVLASRPGWIKSLPRTGPGSVLLKQVMGLLMLAAAAYFIGTGLSTVGMRAGGLPAKTYWWVVAGFGGGAGVWLGFKGLRVAPNRGWRLAVGLLAAVITVVSLATGVELTRREPIDWKVYTPSAFDQALAAGKIPVLVFTAEWCLNCKALEQSALHRQEAIEALQARDVVPLKVDLTAGNPAGKAKLQQVGRLAIPLAVIYDRAGKIVFLSDFYTAGQIRTAIDEARAAPRPTGAP